MSSACVWPVVGCVKPRVSCANCLFDWGSVVLISKLTTLVWNSSPCVTSSPGTGVDLKPRGRD